jgi:hypothetical protein
LGAEAASTVLDARRLLLDEVPKWPSLEELELGTASGDEIHPDVRRHVVGVGSDAEQPDV